MRLAVAALALVACGYDTSRTVYVAPSALHMLPAIIDGAEGLGIIAGGPVFELHVAKSAKRRDDEIIVRYADRLPCVDGVCRVAQCTRTPRGVIVQLTGRATSLHVAHELLHAVGLGHVPDARNLMHRAPYDWNLTEDQVSVLVGD